MAPKFSSADQCPKIESHTTHPASYPAHHAWAERMAKTHRQRDCRSCGFYAIWEPMESEEPQAACPGGKGE